MNNYDYDGLILAAGRGERMGALSGIYPKPLLPVANEPVIAHHLRLFQRLGVREVFIIVGHRAAEVVKVIGDGAQYDVRVKYIEQLDPLGTADAVGRARPYIRKPFIVLLGDYFFSAQKPERLIERVRHRNRSAMAIKRESDVTLITAACAVGIDKAGKVTNMIEKP